MGTFFNGVFVLICSILVRVGHLGQRVFPTIVRVGTSFGNTIGFVTKLGQGFLLHCPGVCGSSFFTFFVAFGTGVLTSTR